MPGYLAHGRIRTPYAINSYGTPLTSDWLSVEEAKQLGMANQIVPREKLQDAALEMAKKITKKALFALKLTKEAVNAAEDAQGRVQAMQTSFALHQLAHTHWLKLYNMLIDPTKDTGLGLTIIRQMLAAYDGLPTYHGALGRRTTFTVILPALPRGET
jgi:hypothetical protein